jgi:hypothetical protein
MTDKINFLERRNAELREALAKAISLLEDRSTYSDKEVKHKISELRNICMGLG